MIKHKVVYANKDIWFNLKYKQVKNFNLSVKPDQSIHISVPKGTPLEDIEHFITSKGHWILQKLNKFDLTKSLENTEKDYVSGETFKYLGRQYRLKIIESNDKESVELKNNYIIIHVKKKDKKKRKQNILNEWFKQSAHSVFSKVLDETYQLVEHMVKPKPNLEIKLMTKRWGSCLKSKHTVLLNTELIKAPKHCIAYVALHELIHFSHRNHDAKFYEVLTVLMPDWKERKAILDEEVVRFI